MYVCTIPICGLLLILNLQLLSTYPISNGLTDTDVDILKVSVPICIAGFQLHYDDVKSVENLQQ